MADEDDLRLQDEYRRGALIPDMQNAKIGDQFRSLNSNETWRLAAKAEGSAILVSEDGGFQSQVRHPLDSERWLEFEPLGEDPPCR